jgi:hypothetical protein
MSRSSLDGGTTAPAKDEIHERRIAMEAVVDELFGTDL